MNTPAGSHQAFLDLLLEAYEDAGVRGLCGDGRWEAAVSTVRAADRDRANDERAVPSSPNPMTGGMTMSEWKPAGYSQVSPYLIVDGADRTIVFLEEVFGAERLRHFPDDQGRVMLAEVRIGDSVIMIADGNEGWPPIGAHVYLYVPDVDEAYRRALAAGGESVQEPVRKDDEDRRGGV